jgi:quercetin dioxygenase-like cupin family protein/transcriptional regulator with XRE-family HTH domain
VSERVGTGASGEAATDVSEDVALRLGVAIRTRRRQLGLTLVDVASQAGLSHPFLSQLERGLARPSMRSLSAIAATLGTTAQVLMVEAEPTGTASTVSSAGRGDSTGPVSVVRAGDQTPDPMSSPGGTVRALVRGERAMLPVEFVGAPRDFDEYYQHPGEEFVYVVHGQIEVDIEGRLYAAATGDSIYYAGGLRHRWRSTSDQPVHVVVVQQSLPSDS